MKINLSERQEIRELGSGGFGNTKLFEDDQSHRFVLKTFAPQGSNDSPKALAMFKAECDRLQEVGTHPQIPSYLGFEETDGSYAIAQEYIPGESFREILQTSGPLMPDVAMESLEKLLVPLKHMHSHQIIHRDIKPDNIILRRSDQAPCIVDFGAAKVATETILAQTGTVIGTANYAAPEQLAGQTSFQSDIYSLGLTIIEMVTSLTPFNLIDYSTGEWTWVEALQDADPRFVAILQRMVQRNLRDRYLNIAAIQQDIADFKRFTLEEAEQQQRDREEEARIAQHRKEDRAKLRRTLIRQVVPSVLGITLLGGAGLTGWQHFEVGDRLAKLLEPTENTEQPKKSEKQIQKSQEQEYFQMFETIVNGGYGLAGFSALAGIYTALRLMSKGANPRDAAPLLIAPFILFVALRLVKSLILPESITGVSQTPAQTEDWILVNPVDPLNSFNPVDQINQLAC